MKYNLLFFALVLFSVMGCVKEKDNKICLEECNNASKTLKLNIVEEESNLSFLASNQKNQENALPLKIYSKRLKKELPYSIEKGTNYIVFDIIGSDEIEVWISNKLEDTIKLETKYIKDECCGILDIVRLHVNDAYIANPDGYLIVIKK